MKIIKADPVKSLRDHGASKNLIACCGLYCGMCGKYLRDKCPGCRENSKAFWCKVRICCLEKKYLTCANCETFKNAKDCPKFNNFFSKVVGFMLRSDRNACICRIKEVGENKFAEEMAEKKRHSIKK